MNDTSSKKYLQGVSITFRNGTRLLLSSYGLQRLGNDELDAMIDDLGKKGVTFDWTRALESDSPYHPSWFIYYAASKGARVRPSLLYHIARTSWVLDDVAKFRAVVNVDNERDTHWFLQELASETYVREFYDLAIELMAGGDMSSVKPWFSVSRLTKLIEHTNTDDKIAAFADALLEDHETNGESMGFQWRVNEIIDATELFAISIKKGNKHGLRVVSKIGVAPKLYQETFAMGIDNYINLNVHMDAVETLKLVYSYRYTNFGWKYNQLTQAIQNDAIEYFKFLIETGLHIPSSALASAAKESAVKVTRYVFFKELEESQGSVAKINKLLMAILANGSGHASLLIEIIRKKIWPPTLTPALSALLVSRPIIVRELMENDVEVTDHALRACSAYAHHLGTDEFAPWHCGTREWEAAKSNLTD